MFSFFYLRSCVWKNVKKKKSEKVRGSLDPETNLFRPLKKFKGPCSSSKIFLGAEALGSLVCLAAALGPLAWLI